MKRKAAAFILGFMFLLKDIYASLGRIAEAWTIYALPHNLKQDKNTKKKLDFVQAKIPQEELSRQMLLRSPSNYTKMFSFKTSYKIKLEVFKQKCLYSFFLYKRRQH